MVKNVRIVSEVDAPQPQPISVTVHYFESGIYKTTVVDGSRPTRFDRIAVAMVDETLPVAEMPAIALNSPRNLARFVYRSLRHMAASAAPAVRLYTPVIDMRGIEPNNVAHLLLDIIPGSLYAKRAVGADVTLLTRKVDDRFRALLATFGITPICEDRRVQGHAVKIRGTRGLSVYDLPAFDCPVISCVPDVFAGFDFLQTSSPKSEKIFIARRGARSLRNHAEVESVARSFGYKTLFMEDYSIAEQLSIGANARHVIALHGAAMSYLVFAKQLDSVIELFPPNVHHELYPACLGARVKSYHQIVADFDPAVMHSGWDATFHFKSQPFSVDTNLLKMLLAQIHS